MHTYVCTYMYYSLAHVYVDLRSYVYLFCVALSPILASLCISIIRTYVHTCMFFAHRGEIKSSHASVEKAPVKRKRGRPPSNKKSVKRDRVATKLTLPTQDMHGSDDSFDGTSHEWDPKDRIQLFK